MECFNQRTPIGCNLALEFVSALGLVRLRPEQTRAEPEPEPDSELCSTHQRATVNHRRLVRGSPEWIGEWMESGGFVGAQSLAGHRANQFGHVQTGPKGFSTVPVAVVGWLAGRLVG